MCLAPKAPKLPDPPPPPPLEIPVTPMASPEDLADTTGDLRKAKSRKGLRIDMAPGGASGKSGLNIPT